MHGTEILPTVLSSLSNCERSAFAINLGAIASTVRTQLNWNQYKMHKAQPNGLRFFVVKLVFYTKSGMTFQIYMIFH